MLLRPVVFSILDLGSGNSPITIALFLMTHLLEGLHAHQHHIAISILRHINRLRAFMAHF